MKESLIKKEAVIVIATPKMRKAVIAKMDALNVNIQNSKNEGQIKFFDAIFSLSNFIFDDELNNLFIQNIFSLPIESLKIKYGSVHVVDEMVDVLRNQEKKFAALKLEQMWNERAVQQGFSIIFCNSSTDFLSNPNNYLKKNLR